MEENSAEGNKMESPMELDRQDSAKRIKTDFDSEENSNFSMNYGNNVNTNCFDQTGSTSSDCGLPTSSTDCRHTDNEDKTSLNSGNCVNTNCFDQTGSTSSDSGLPTSSTDCNHTDNEDKTDNLDWLDVHLNNVETDSVVRLKDCNNDGESSCGPDEQVNSSSNTSSDHTEDRQSNGNLERPFNGLEEVLDTQSDLASQESDSNMSTANEFSCDSDMFSRRSSSSSTILPNTDIESDTEAQAIEVLKKEKPKHTWFVVPEVMKRQYGYCSRLANPVNFQKRCYGSLMPVQKLELMYKLEDHEGCVNCLNFSPNGRWLASGSDDLKVVVWDWAIGKPLIKIQTKHKRNIFQSRFLNFKGSDLHLVTTGKDGQVWYLQVANYGLRQNQKLGQHRGPCHKLAVLEDKPHIILSAGEDGIVFNHDIRKPKSNKIVYVKDDCDREVALYSIHNHPLKSEQFCIAGRENCVRLYDQRKASSPLAKFHPHTSNDRNSIRNAHITCAVFNHDGSEILASYNDDDIYLFDTDAGPGQYAHRYSGHRNGATIKGVAFFGPRSEFVMSGSDCAHIFFWERKTERIVQFLLADDNGVVNCLEPHPELPYLATSGLDWDVKLWVPSCEELPSLKNLAETVKENKRNGWEAFDPSSESQILWMLWRRLRASNAARQRQDAGNDDGGLSSLTLDSSEDSSSDSWTSHSGDDDDYDMGPAGCSTA